MDLLFFWLPIIGGVLLGGIAGNAWYGGNRVLAIWLGFAGVICFELVLAFQLEQAVTKVNRPSLTDIAIKQSRANIFVSDVQTQNIDDDMMAIGPTKIPSIRVVIENSGQTPAYGVTHQIAARLAEFPPPNGLFKLPNLGRGSVDNLPAGGKSMAEVGVGQPLGPDQKTLLGLGRLAVYLFGRIEYTDAFGEQRCTKYRMMVGGNAGFNGTRMVKMSEGNEADKDCE